MKRIVLLLSMLCAAEIFAAGDSFAPVWGDSATYSNNFAKIDAPGKVFPQTLNGKKYLQVKRGGVWHQINLSTPLKNSDTFSYSFTLVRKEANASFISMICADKYTPVIGSILVTVSGNISLWHADRKWKNAGIKLEPNKEYKITVIASIAKKSYKVIVDGIGEAEASSVVAANINKLIFSPQPPDNNTNYIGDLNFTLNPEISETVSDSNAVPFYAPVLGVPSTYRNAYAGFVAPGKVYPQTRNGKKYLQVKRGGVWHQVDFLSVLSNLDYSYSFTLVRAAADSSFIAMICADRAAPSIGSIFITQSGNISLYASDMKWKNVGIKLDANKEYKITVVVSNSKKSYKVIVDGVGEAEMSSVVQANANKLILAPQPPENNISYVGDLKFYYNN